MGELVERSEKMDLVMLIVRVVILVGPMSQLIFLPTLIYSVYTVLSVSKGEVLIDQYGQKSQICLFHGISTNKKSTDADFILVDSMECKDCKIHLMLIPSVMFGRRFGFWLIPWIVEIATSALWTPYCSLHQVSIYTFFSLEL